MSPRIQTPRLSLCPSGSMLVELEPGSDTAREAYFYSFSQAQADARQVSSDPTSAQYFEAMQTGLKGLGWNILALRPFSGTSADHDTPLALGLRALMHFVTQAFPFLPVTYAQISQRLSAIYHALETAPENLQNMLDQWWDNSLVSGSTRMLVMGPLFDILHATATIATHFSLSFQGDSWRSLIRPTSRATVHAAPLAMVLDLHAYRKVEAQLQARFKASVIDHIATATLDLGGETGGKE